MRSSRHWLIPIIVLVVAVCQLASCAGRGGPGATEQSGGEPFRPIVADEAMLPAPSELLAHLSDAPRRTAYVEADLIRHGMDYEGDFPKRNVSKVGETASFEPSWS